MPRFALLLGLVVASGACGLTYQILWLRQLSLVFGVTSYAASTVLGAFMGGLAAGSLVAPRAVALFGRPIVLFGIAEILIGLCALATPRALDGATELYRFLSGRWPESLALLTVARAVAAFVVLFIPTLLMGLTLPVLTASQRSAGPSLGARSSALYAANTAGAVFGTLVTGYYLIGGIGMGQTFLLAASINVAIGIVAVLVDLPTRAPALARAAPLPDPVHDTPEPFTATTTGRLLLAVTALTGFASLALEVVWFRVLLQYITATTYAFTTMLATVLGGIAVGGAIAARRLRRDRDWLASLATLLAWTGAAVLLSQIFLAWSYNAGWRTSGLIQASAAAILPAAILMGVTFPLLLRLAALPPAGGVVSNTTVARGVGRVYALNVAGAILGALAGGFLILPVLGSRNGLLALAALYPVMAVMLASRRSATRRRLTTGLAAGLTVFAVCAGIVRDPFEAAAGRRNGPEFREVWRDEGAQTSVSVQTNGEMRVMFLDGVHQASDHAPMVRLHRIIGHLPMVLHRDPRDVLAIGLGGGATPGAFSQYPDARVRIVELSPSVVGAGSQFAHINYDVLSQPNVRLRQDDGRNFLMLTSDRFDVITADTIHPENAGAGNLYSKEYFTLVRNALRDEGLVVQWIGAQSETYYKLIMRTFLDVFPDATLWFDGTLMVAGRVPLEIDLDNVERRRRIAVTRQALDEIGLVSGDVLRSWFTGGPAEMRAFVGPGAVLTDDQPLLEYHRSVRGPSTPLIDLGRLRGEIAPFLAPRP